jgi:hypothetical protein
MNPNEIAQPSELETRATWVKPSLARLRSGSAENIRGSTIQDGPLEMIAS